MEHIQSLNKAVTAVLLLLLFNNTILAQQTIKPKPEMNGMDQLLEYSRPGEHHAALHSLCGTWNYQDAKRTFVKGTLVRKAIYNGRFYNVEITGGKLKVPVADGQMKEELYQGLQLEGYDNARAKFVTISVNNHIGSDIQQQTGSFDATKKEFTYEWENELTPGAIVKNKRIVRITDASHYTEEYYEQLDGKYTKVRQLEYTKTSE